MTVVEGNQKVPFSIATTPRYRGGRYSFPWITPLYPWYVSRVKYCWMLSKEVSSTILKTLLWRDMGLKPGFLDHWRTLYPLGQWLDFGKMVWVFVHGPGELGSISARVIPKTQKTLSIIRYGSKVKWINPGKGLAPSPTTWCGCYRKGKLGVTLHYGHFRIKVSSNLVNHPTHLIYGNLAIKENFWKKTKYFLAVFFFP